MSTERARRVRIVGPGRAGGSFARALHAVGWQVEVVAGRGTARRAAGSSTQPAADPGAHDPTGSDPGDDGEGPLDLVLLCVPDGAVAAVATSLQVEPEVVVAHCAGSLGLDVLAPAERRASIHPLVALPDAERGAERLQGSWFAVAGDPIAREVVAALGGSAVEVRDDHRARYHAAASIASNHLVALMGQVERVAASVGVPLEAYLALAAGSLDDVAALGPAAALTGPVRRGDLATVQRHLDALPEDEREAYEAMARAAARLVPPP